MGYSYRIDKINRIVLVTIVGELNAINFEKLCLAIYKMALMLKCKVIFDFTSANITICIGAAYFWFTEHLDHIDVRFRSIPIACIASDRNLSFLEFVEITWSNIGVNVKVFNARKLALKWLTSFGNEQNDTRVPPYFQDFIVGF